MTLCFLVRKIYFLINHQPFGAGRDLLLSADAAVSLAALMILLGALSRLGTDEMWDWRDGSRQITACVLSGVLPYIGSLVCFIVLMIDFVLAADGMENAMVFRSFFLVWIGYPLVSLVSIGVRNYSSRAVDGYPGYVSPLLSMFKDLAYGLLDDDAFVTLCNGAGFGFGLLQLGVYCYVCFLLQPLEGEATPLKSKSPA